MSFGSGEDNPNVTDKRHDTDPTDGTMGVAVSTLVPTHKKANLARQQAGLVAAQSANLALRLVSSPSFGIVGGMCAFVWLFHTLGTQAPNAQVLQAIDKLVEQDERRAEEQSEQLKTIARQFSKPNNNVALFQRVDNSSERPIEQVEPAQQPQTGKTWEEIAPPGQPSQTEQPYPQQVDPVAFVNPKVQWYVGQVRQWDGATIDNWSGWCDRNNQGVSGPDDRGKLICQALKLR